MEKWKKWKLIVITAGVIASAAFYISGREPAEIVLTDYSETAAADTENAEAAGDIESKEVAESAENAESPENAERMGDVDTGQDTLTWEQQKEEVKLLVREAVREAVREEIRLAGREGYLERALEEADALAAQEAEARKGMVNLNAATREELMTLPGIGSQRAEEILSYREAAGGFQKAEDIMKVPGIKEGAYAKLKDKIYVE